MSAGEASGSPVRETYIRSARDYVEMRFPAAILLIVSMTCLLKSAAAASDELSSDDKLRHSEAIALARSEAWPEALQLLSELRRSNPSNESHIVDEAVVLAWSGQDREAAEIASGLDPASIPAYGLEAIAKACRNVQMYERALALYEALTILEPENLNGFSGLIMTRASSRSW